ncbi:unnamed protein product [Brachionus calyciflorus]|uniref:Uncharacterized protein n=1 Tax=Brachionus calyciflorus TaxID=104777 RepID=A0A814NKU0_9BILA|nr:unnamed protein product [Brachionus calyciflorus]
MFIQGFFDSEVLKNEFLTTESIGNITITEQARQESLNSCVIFDAEDDISIPNENLIKNEDKRSGNYSSNEELINFYMKTYLSIYLIPKNICDEIFEDIQFF